MATSRCPLWRPDNNQGPWVKLENFERELATEGNELYIIAGAFGTGGYRKEADLQNDSRWGGECSKDVSESNDNLA
jgi:hypothetical protein